MKKERTNKDKMIEACMPINKHYTKKYLEEKSELSLLRLMHPDNREYWARKLGYTKKEIENLNLTQKGVKIEPVNKR